MSDNKKYYYLKLKESFYERDEMVLLESMPDGYMYSNILLKLYLRSLKNDGKLLVNERIPYNATILANITRMPVAVVEKAIQIFKELELIEVLDNGAIYMLDIQNFIGESSTEADRKRLYRKKIEEEKLLISGQMSGQISDKNPPEIELEKEIDIELEKKKKKKGSKKEGTKKNYNTYNTIIDEYTENEELKNTILEFIKMRTMIKSKMTDNALNLMLNKLDKLTNDDEMKIKILEQSIMNSWKGVFPLKEDNSIKQNSSNADSSNVFLDMLNGGV
ncbi:phage replisome organizer N-terminal domain-containing protein [Clostridium sporogenes]|uniref:phage replisome organizer N-terminal domain-containing protein n=1 Tax=Clostridium sporogenes TaxID=1509 RepID=UPI003F9354D6